MLRLVANSFRSNGFLKLASLMGNTTLKLNELKVKSEIERHKSEYQAKERRVITAIEMLKEPDRVPTSTGGLNFFPAKYTGITCAEYMFDAKKMKYAFMKTIEDYNFDLIFPSFMLSMGRVITASKLNLFRIPGRDLTINSGYQFNEIERLKQEEYKEFLERGMDFMIDTIVPRTSGIFQMKPYKRFPYLGRVVFEGLKFISTATNLLAEVKAKGQYNLMTGVAFPPFDIMSFVFRDLSALTRDMMKKETKSQLLELIKRIEPWLTTFLSALPQMNGSTGIFFPSERAFSLSPKQFEQFYWPTLKKMIISFVKAGDIPFLVWEQDVAHLVHFLLELPKSISRRCCFMCDTSDIFKVHKILDGHMSIMANVPLSTMCVGSPKDVEQYCEKLFTELKPGGGLILSSALGIPDEAKPENVRAMVNYALKYGNYS